MELFQTEDHYVLLDGDYSLWCCRSTGKLKAGNGADLCSAWNPVCIGQVYGVVGKLKIHPDSEWKLLLIRQRTLVGKLSGRHAIYRINKVSVLPLDNGEVIEMDFDLCKKHHFGMKKPERIIQNSNGQNKPLQKTWNTIKSAAETVKPKKKEVKDKEKFQKRISEELQKMYNESEFFYYSDSYDLTNSIQQQHQDSYDKTSPLWKRADDRFFWNRHLLKELIESEDQLANHWILPIVQGYVQIEQCTMNFEENKKSSPSDSNWLVTKATDPLSYKICVISRRSRHRAGTRSKKRGVEESGACANYVETEQVVEFAPHLVSFVQVRGSIPVYWSQSGYKYRPPPRLDRDDKETHDAFLKHIDEQLAIFEDLTILTLVELTGKEKTIGDAYLSHILDLNSPNVTYITFDFHEYCRGMKFENVSILTDAIRNMIKDMKYCWADNRGLICEQQGVFRVNCIDCLDRTNVVQTAIARIVMETQFRKLGLLPPDETLPPSCRKTYQQLWANNGDAISRQYAGTAALKGDFTRTGERKISGLMKDGVNSANRYYLRFKDAYRQAAIDLTLGRPIADDLQALISGRADPEEDSNELVEKEQNVKMLIEDCKKMLIVEPEECLGGWSLVNADPVCGDPDRQDMDVILLLSQRACYIAWYDDDEEQVTQYQMIYLEDLEKMEIGPEPSIFKSKFVCLRLHYRHYAEDGFFHTFRTPSTRLFNNIVVAIRNQEEARESLNYVCQAFAAAQKIPSLKLTVVERQKLDRKKTRMHPEIKDVHQQQQEISLAGIKLPRDISHTDLTSADNRDASVKVSKQNNESLWLPRFNFIERLSPKFERKAASMYSKKPKSSQTKAPDSKSVKENGFSLLGNTNLNLGMPSFNLQSLNPMNKVQIGNAARAAMRLPSRFYTSILENVHKDDIEKLGGYDETFAAVDKKVRKLSREYSKDDISTTERQVLDGETLMIDTSDEEDVMLGSCGILATSPGQFLSTTLSLTNMTSLEDLSASWSERQTGQSSFANAQSRDKAEDLCLGVSDPKPQVTDMELFQDYQEQLAPVRDSVELDLLTGEPLPYMDASVVDTTCSPNLNDVNSMARITKYLQTSLRSDVKGVNLQDSDLTMLPGADVSGGNTKNLEFIHDFYEIKVEDIKALEKRSKLQHTLMKTSFSDGAISFASDADSIMGNKPLQLRPDTGPLSRLRMKMSNLPLITMSNLPLPRTVLRKSHRGVEDLEKMVNEKLGDADCKTKILFI